MSRYSSILCLTCHTASPAILLVHVSDHTLQQVLWALAEYTPKHHNQQSCKLSLLVPGSLTLWCIMQALQRDHMPVWEHVTRISAVDNVMTGLACSQVHTYLKAVDPSHDNAAITEMLQAIMDVDDRDKGRASIKFVAVMTMLEREMWDLAAVFMRKHTPSADPEQLDSCPSLIYSTISALISRKPSSSLLERCLSFLRGYCTDQCMSHLWGDTITLSQHHMWKPPQFLLAVQEGNQELCRSAKVVGPFMRQLLACSCKT